MNKVVGEMNRDLNGVLFVFEVDGAELSRSKAVDCKLGVF